MTDEAWRKILLRAGMPLDEAARHLSALHFAKEALTDEARNLLGIAEGLLELVRLGASIYMDSDAIDADLYGTTEGKPDTRAQQPAGRGEEKSPRPSDALQEADREALQAVFDRYQVVNVLVSGPTASGADEPGNDLDLLFGGPETFSLYTLVDLTADLEALLGVPVNLVSNHPVNQGWLMDQYRAAASPLDDLLQSRDQRIPVDSDASPVALPAGPGEAPLDDAEIQAGIDALDLPAEFTARQSWWSEWDSHRGTVDRFIFDPDSGDIEALIAALRQRHSDGHIIVIGTWRATRM